MKEIVKQNLAKAIVLNCFRNSELENLHAGIGPSSKTGDYSDVKVVTPYGEIPWNEVSRFNNEEMKTLMIDVVDLTYSAITLIDNPKTSKIFWEGMQTLDIQPNWNKPKMHQEIKNALNFFKKNKKNELVQE